MEDYLKVLNDAQRQAVEYCDGPELVIAGAGSGKTRVLTHKIMHLLKLGVEPWRILALTFTNKAAREMRERISTLVGPTRAGKLWMGTFHSIFARILRLHAHLIGYKSSFTIYDSSDSRSAIKMIIRDLGLDEKIYRPNTVAAAISWAKNALVSPESYAANGELLKADNEAKRGRINEIYAIYRNRCVASNAMDFDDLLYYMYVLLRDNEQVLSHYREYFEYVLVDEYQDTNYAQHVIVTALTQPRGHLTVVGDDAQSIYSFRGANIRNILDLEKSYPTLRTFKLEQNYRSTQTIINAAGSLIEKNREGIPKKVFSMNAPGNKITVDENLTDREEAATIATQLSRLYRTGKDSYEEFAILYRTNAQSRGLEEALRQNNIPYRIYGGLSFYQRKEVKDAVAYFRAALNPDDDEAIKRIINYPARGIGETTMNKLIRGAIDENCSIMAIIRNKDLTELAINRGTATKLSKFGEMIMDFNSQALSSDDAYQVARGIMNVTGLISQYRTDRTPENISKMENLEELMSGIRQFVDEHQQQGDNNVQLADFMAEISLATDQDSDNDGDAERVTLMTAHAAKGLEFNNIFIVGVEEDLFPSSMSQGSNSEIEEERRLLYVALTRARNFCMMTYARSRYRNGMMQFTRPSRFLKDIDPKYLNWVSQQRVTAPENNPMSSYRASWAWKDTTAPARPKLEHLPETDGISYIVHTSAEVKEGMKIRHSVFGDGVITMVDTEPADHRIDVEFEKFGTKKLLLKFAKFHIFD